MIIEQHVTKDSDMPARSIETCQENMDAGVVAGFGKEWSRFDQSALVGAEYERLFQSYFRLFPWSALTSEAEGFDLGCGSGRWARGVAPRVALLHCIDASSEAVAVAKRNLAQHSNCRFHVASVTTMPIPDGSMDFGYSLGVLHHVPDTAGGLRSCVTKLKSGAPFLVYLYYAFDNRPRWYRNVWRATDSLRKFISRTPSIVRLVTTHIIATMIYWPLARLALTLDHFRMDVSNLPLASYRNSSFYSMRTDAYDRFATRLERRFSQSQIRAMMEDAGLEKIQFSSTPPFWSAIGWKK